MGKTAWSGQQTVTGKGTRDRPDLTAEEDGAAAHRAQIDDCFVKQIMVS